LADRIDPVEQGHRHVGDDHVGVQFRGGAQQVAAVGHRASQLELFAQQLRQSLQDDLVVIGEQHAEAPRNHHGVSGWSR
jgi:hypothetical protein